MIATWRGLAITGAIAIALVIAVIVDVARGVESTVVDRALLPGFDAERATELVWERPGQPALRAVRSGDRWELRAPASLPADPDAISEVLAALRGARWHRRGEAPAPHATLTVVLGGARHALGFAAPIAGTEQSWLTVDGRGLVVDRWVVRALDRDQLGLQIRRPLAEAAGARTIAIAGGTGAPVDLELEGSPRRRVRPGALLLASEPAAALERALRDVTIVRISDGPSPAPLLRIRIAGGAAPAAGIAIGLGGACPGAPGLIALSGSAGVGCIEPAQLAAIEAAVARLQQAAPDAIVERRPLPIEPQRLILADGAALDTSPPRLGDAGADPVRVAELLAALAAPAEVAALPAAPPTAHLVATDRAGTAIALDLYAERLIARRGEPVALRPAPGAWRLLVRPSRELRDPALWLEEPATITAIAIDGITYRRGQVIGDWTREPAGPVDAARVEALAARLAAPRAIGPADAGLAVAHRVAIDVAPPAGAAIHHALELGAPRGATCPARTGRDAVALPAALCAEVAALAAR